MLIACMIRDQSLITGRGGSYKMGCGAGGGGASFIPTKRGDGNFV